MQNQANAYKKIVQNLNSFILRDSVREVVDDFRKTRLYTEAFLYDIKRGLIKSSYTSKPKSPAKTGPMVDQLDAESGLGIYA